MVKSKRKSPQNLEALSEYMNFKRRASDKDLPVKKYICPIQEFPTSWRKVLIKTPFEIVKELAIAVVKFFTENEKMWLFESISPLHISSNCGVLSLCEYIYRVFHSKEGKVILLR